MRKTRKPTKTDLYWYRLGYLNAEQQFKQTVILMKKVNGILYDAVAMLDKEKPIEGVGLGLTELEKIIKVLKNPPNWPNRPFIRKLQQKLDAARAAAGIKINEAIKETVEEK